MVWLEKLDTKTAINGTNSHRVPVADRSAKSRTATNVRTDARIFTMTDSRRDAVCTLTNCPEYGLVRWTTVEEQRPLSHILSTSERIGSPRWRRDDVRPPWRHEGADRQRLRFCCCTLYSFNGQRRGFIERRWLNTNSAACRSLIQQLIRQ